MTHNASVDAGGVLIRPREPDDLGGLVDALALVADNDGYPSHWPEQPASWLRTSDAYGAWVADRNGDLLGHVVLRRPGGQMPVTLWCAASGNEPHTCAMVSRLFVVPYARGAGVGRALLDAACAAAADLNLQPVLDVADTNQAAIRLYHRLGWQHLGSYQQAFQDGGPPELLHCFAAPSPSYRQGTRLQLPATVTVTFPAIGGSPTSWVKRRARVARETPVLAASFATVHG